MDDTIRTSAEAHEDAAMPRRHDVHTENGDSGAPDLPKGVTDKPVARKSPAEWAYERLILYIKSFEEQLDSEHEVAMGFAGGEAGVLRIEGMGFFDPDIVTFYGTDAGGARTQLIQHVSQLNVTLVASPKHIDQPEPNRIGFQLASALDGDEDVAT